MGERALEVRPLLRPLPKKPYSAEEILKTLDEYSAHDLDPHSGKMWAHSYETGLSELLDVARKAYVKFMDKTMLNFTVYPSILRMENEVVAIMASFMHGDERTVGSFTYGGTESIMLAVKAARDHYRRVRRGPEPPEMVLPSTAHPAFYKAADFLGLEVVKVPVDPETLRAVPDAMNEAIGERTALVVGSAPNYPYGTVDPIKALGEIALDKGVWLHVDACIGFVLPFFKKLGVDVPDFDFSVEGVNSISVDLHKYGYAPKGASVVLYRSEELRLHHIYVNSVWPGYPLVNTVVLSTRSAGPLAAAWAVLHYLGEEGYLEMAKRVLKARETLMKGLPELGFEVLGQPESSLIAFTSGDVNIFQLADWLKGRGWYVQVQPGSRALGIPPSLHLTISPVHEKLAGAFLEALAEGVEEVKELPETGAEELMEKLKIAEMPLETLEEAMPMLLRAIGIGEGEAPAEMALINELIYLIPPEIVELVFRHAVSELFKPAKQG